MAVQPQLVTVEEFDRIATLPENADKRLEFIGGEVVELVSNNYSSEIAATILREIGNYVKAHKLGRVTGADGGYKVSGDRYIPDVAFISKAKQPESSREAYNSNPPDLAVEVISPGNSIKEISDKVANYLAAGTLLWVIYPDEQQAKVYEAGQPVKTINIDGVLEGGTVLPGFKLPLKDIFAE